MLYTSFQHFIPDVAINLNAIACGQPIMETRKMRDSVHLTLMCEFLEQFCIFIF
jgi:hypothetical protein